MNHTEEKNFTNLWQRVNMMEKAQQAQTKLLEDICNSLVDLDQRVKALDQRIKAIDKEVEKWHSSTSSSQQSEDDQQN